ncbi:MAG: helix-turn-helix domain-containing protein [Treponema sp.]|nr:helix-turn-helix domain-containing protein [Treponema sp.]
MLWTVKQAARFLELNFRNMYYPIAMGEIEAVKVGRIWRLSPEGVKEYDKLLNERKDRKSADHFIYSGDGGFLFRTLPHHLPANPGGETAGMERRRGKLVYSSQRHQAVFLEKLKPVEQLELFTA